MVDKGKEQIMNLEASFGLAFDFVKGERYEKAEDVVFAFGEGRMLGSAHIGYVAEFFEMTQSMCGDSSIVYVVKGKNPVVEDDSPGGSGFYAGHPSGLSGERK